MEFKAQKYFFAIILVVLLQVTGFASGFANTILQDGIGIRPLGMGGAFSAIADDANSLYFNPAGLGSTSFQYVSGSLDNDRSYYPQSRYDYLAIGNMGYGYLGANNSGGESVNANYYGYGFREGHGFLWGINYKTAQWDTLAGSGQGYSGDLGLLLRVTPWLQTSVVAADFAAAKNYVVKPTTRLGVALLPMDGQLKFASDVVIDPERPGENLTYLGAEYFLTESLAIRGGSFQGNSTLGASFALGFINLEYASLYNSAYPQESVQKMGFSIEFKPERKRYMSLVKPKEYLLLDLKGTLIGGRSQFSLLGGNKKGADSILLTLKSAENDRDLDGVVLRLGGMDTSLAGMAVVEEIQSEIKQLKMKGKKVIAYVEGSAVGDEYYLASCADKIVAADGSFVGGFGRMITLTKLKGLFDKIGIEWQVIAIGKYKDTFNSYSEQANPEQREMLEELVQDNYRRLIESISENRKIEISKVKAVADGQIFSAATAKKLGLVDEIGFLSDAKGDANLVSVQDLMPNAGTDFFLQYLNKIAVIEIDGEIVTGNNGENILFGGRVVGADTIVDQIKRATDDPSIKAILLRVNSPGGSSIASAQIYTELMKARKKNKVVVASMGEIAASGGYMVSSAAEKIIADPSTLTGAIGVITGDGIPVFKGLYGKLGVKVDTIKEGKHADMFAGTRKMTTDEVQSMKDIFKESYDDFVSKVAIGREFPTKEVYSMAEGRVYTGQQAKDLGLVDKLGGFVDAIQETKSLAGIRGDARLIYYENYRGFWYESSVNALLKQPGVIELIGQSWRQILGSQSDN